MALLNCPECNREISDTADMCPHCGYKLQSKPINTVSQEKKKKIFIGVAVAILIVCVGVALLCITNAGKSNEKMIIGEWEVSEMSLDGENSFDIDLLTDLGYDVAGDLSVDDNSWTMTFSYVTENGSWSKYDEEDGTVTYILTSDSTYFASINEKEQDVLYLLMDLGEEDKMYLTYTRKSNDK